MDRVKNFYWFTENPIILSCRSHFKWAAGQLDALPYNEPQRDEAGRIRPKFDSNPWKDFFSFTNALFRDFYHETASNAQDWREMSGTRQGFEDVLIDQPLVVRRILE